MKILELSNLVCKICRRKFSNFIGLSGHIKKHKIQLEDYYLKYLKKDCEGICLTCGKKTNFSGLPGGYCKFCSSKCRANNKEIKDQLIRTNLKNRGISNPSQSKEVQKKKEETNLKNHNVKYPMQSKEIQKKSKHTNLKNHGFEYPMQSKIVQEKHKNTCLKNLGVEYPMQSKIIQYEGRQTCIKKYGVDSFSKTHQFRQLAGKNMRKMIEFGFKNGQKFSPTKGKDEKLVFTKLQNYCSYTLLEDQEIGIYWPDRLIKELNLIIEYDEKEHLQECFKKHDQIRDEFFKLNGYNPIHIKESDWFEDKELQIIKVQETIKFLEQVNQLNSGIN